MFSCFPLQDFQDSDAVPLNQGEQTASKRTAHGTEVQHSLLSQGPLRGNASRACMAQIRAATQAPVPCFFGC